MNFFCLLKPVAKSLEVFEVGIAAAASRASRHDRPGLGLDRGWLPGLGLELRWFPGWVKLLGDSEVRGEFLVLVGNLEALGEAARVQQQLVGDLVEELDPEVAALLPADFRPENLVDVARDHHSVEALAELLELGTVAVKDGHANVLALPVPPGLAKKGRGSSGKQRRHRCSVRR